MRHFDLRLRVLDGSFLNMMYRERPIPVCVYIKQGYPMSQTKQRGVPSCFCQSFLNVFNYQQNNHRIAVFNNLARSANKFGCFGAFLKN